MKSQECSKCKKELHIDNFSISQNPIRGTNYHTRELKYSSVCKVCSSIWQKEYRAKKIKEDPNFYKKRDSKPKLTQEQKFFNSFISSRMMDAKQRSKKYNKPLNIDKEYLKSIWTGKCAISGFPITTIKKDSNVGSLDCIIPSDGYVVGNVQWLSWKVNRAKGDLPMEEFLEMCEAIVEGATTIETTS